MKTQTIVRKRIGTPKQVKTDSRLLESELIRLQESIRMGFEVRVEWLPGKIKHHNGKRLAEEAVGDTIFIYTCDTKEAVRLVAHGFGEWLLNKHSQPYREMINKLIELFELQQYQNKEKVVDVLTRLLEIS